MRNHIQTLAANRRKDARGELRIATTPTQARFVLPGAHALHDRGPVHGHRACGDSEVRGTPRRMCRLGRGDQELRGHAPHRGTRGAGKPVIDEKR